MKQSTKKQEKKKQETILWGDTKSELLQKSTILFNNHIPYSGECKNDDETINNDFEALRIISKIYYNVYNNGRSDFNREKNEYKKNNIKSPVDYFINLYYMNKSKLEITTRQTIKWCWDRNATRQDKYEFLTWKRNRVL